MPSVSLTAGDIRYEVQGPEDAPPVVFVHGLAMDGTLWNDVVERLSADHRCIVPTFPIGGHSVPMNPDADLSPEGLAAIQGEFLEALDLRDVTLVGNDSGIYLFTAAAQRSRISGLLISTCEAFERFPPGLPGWGLWLAAKVPGGLTMMAQTLRLRFVRRTPMAFGWMTRKRLENATTDRWLDGVLHQRLVRRDLVRYLRGAKRGAMQPACEALATFDRPTTVLWTPEDKVMNPKHGARFAELIPGAELVEVPDSLTLIPIDQPDVFAGAVRKLVARGRRASVGAA